MCRCLGEVWWLVVRRGSLEDEVFTEKVVANELSCMETCGQKLNGTKLYETCFENKYSEQSDLTGLGMMESKKYSGVDSGKISPKRTRACNSH